jgi:phosphohistidine phosphatase SixA
MKFSNLYPRLLVATLLCASTLAAQSTVFVVRHADREAPEPDPPLTPLGFEQAAALARTLADTPVTHIYTSEALRTHQTAAPTAERFHIHPVEINAKELDKLIGQVRATLKPGEATLVVGHRASVPRIVKALTGKEVTPLRFDEFDRLEIVTLFADGRSNVVTLRYATACSLPATAERK